MGVHFFGATSPFVVKPLPDTAPRQPKSGNGRLQKLLDRWRGNDIANAEPAFGLPEVLTVLARALGRRLPESAKDATEVQEFWRSHGPMRREAFEIACQRAKESLGHQRPLAVLLADIARQIEGDADSAATGVQA